MHPDPLKLWPDELVRSYKDLPLPTLYDFALSGEKVSMEIKKQNKEIKALSTTIEKALQNLSELSTPKEQPNEERKAYEQIMIASFDAIVQLRQQVEKSSAAVPRSLSFKRGRFRKKQKEQAKKVEETLDAYLEGLYLLEEKFLSSLADLGLEPIAPKQGDFFSPDEHRAVLKTGSGVPGTIHQTVRYGYRNVNRIIRYADVIIN
jgi:molecular chaperone GrpE (heat shock protein)